jgi:hypothetical protein
MQDTVTGINESAHRLEKMSHVCILLRLKWLLDGLFEFVFLAYIFHFAAVYDTLDVSIRWKGEVQVADVISGNINGCVQVAV